ncbi:uncharacterized protein B4U79_11997 [Dinothrombium tinctorium]|uniref:Uncharacterized protein n=1 Tax=Dinothrombium tinctorium TaxID=1965070 RepID=A0A3S3P5U8_9ACAR|nr:uncharacterized protein B4U79_11997 [Dinothrombium tinctorium]
MSRFIESLIAERESSSVKTSLSRSKMFSVSSSPSKTSILPRNAREKIGIKPNLKSIKIGRLSSSLPASSEPNSTRFRTDSTTRTSTYGRSVSVQYDESQTNSHLSAENLGAQRIRSYSVTAKGSVVKLADLYIPKKDNANTSREALNLLVSSNNLSDKRALSIGNCNRLSCEYLNLNSAKINRYKVLIKGVDGVGKLTTAHLLLGSEDEIGSPVFPKDRRKVAICIDGEHYEFMFYVNSNMKTTSLNNNEKFAAVLFMYSVTDKGSFEAVRKYLSAMACDYNKFIVSTNEGKFLAEAFQIKYIETSAEINHNINELLVGIGKQIKLKQEQQMLLASNETLRSCSFSSSSSLAHQNATLVKRKHSSFAQKMLQKLLGKSKRKSCDNLFVP